MASHLAIGHARIDQPDDPPLDAAAGDGNFLFGLNQAVVDIVPLPKMRLDAGLGIGRTLGMIDVPQAGNPPRPEQIVQVLDLFGKFHQTSFGDKSCSSGSKTFQWFHSFLTQPVECFSRTAGTIETFGTIGTGTHYLMDSGDTL